MNGIEFYSFLKNTFKKEGETICDGYTFQGWIRKMDGTVALRFATSNGLIKSIPQNILVDAWEAGIHIRDSWLVAKDYPRYSNDCRLHLLNDLIEMCAALRQIAA